MCGLPSTGQKVIALTAPSIGRPTMDVIGTRCIHHPKSLDLSIKHMAIGVMVAIGRPRKEWVPEILTEAIRMGGSTDALARAAFPKSWMLLVEKHVL